MAQSPDPAYFRRLSEALKAVGRYRPTLVIDKARLDHNLDQVKRASARGFDLRIVAKSLPSAPMLAYLMERLGTNRLMSFHQPFLLEAARHFPEADILLGKPLPVGAARQVCEALGRGKSGFRPDESLTWLIDSNERLQEYEALAASLGMRMRISLEIDVGLHRGGFSPADPEAFRAALARIKASSHLSLSGLMGYEPYIAKLPKFISSPEKSLARATVQYRAFRSMVEELFGAEAADEMIFNTGGSMTYGLYEAPGPATELSLASALVMPTDFDLPALGHHRPAAFIATPVLKLIDRPEVPLAPGLSTLMRRFGRLPEKACFIYGGNWLARPCFPQGLKRSTMFGHSSNQEMYDLPAGTGLAPDDYLFFRPSQSEAVFLQFGDIALFDGDRITETWPVFQDQL